MTESFTVCISCFSDLVFRFGLFPNLLLQTFFNITYVEDRFGFRQGYIPILPFYGRIPVGKSITRRHHFTVNVCINSRLGPPIERKILEGHADRVDVEVTLHTVTLDGFVENYVPYDGRK